MSELWLAIQIYALAIVISLIVAALIKAVVVALPLLEGRGAAPQPAVAPPAPAPGIPPEHVAAIGAAVAAMLPGHDILHIEDRSRGAIWTAEGRMMHQTSHNVPHERRH